MSCGKSQSAVGLLFAFNFQKKKKMKLIILVNKMGFLFMDPPTSPVAFVV